MLIIPAIDIKNGNCVRLIQGDPDRETVYSRNPVEMAKRFQDAGAKMIHMVDLDGAFEGAPVNDDVIIETAKAVAVPVEVGGGIRTIDSIKKYADNGIKRIIIGTVVLDPSFKNLAERFKGLLVAGIDASDGMVATHGWKNVTAVRALDIIKDIRELGIRKFIYTDIATDGMLSGPNIGAIEAVLTAVPGIELIASGGISSMKDIEDLARLEGAGLAGCITGKAVYEKKIDLGEAISRFG